MLIGWSWLSNESNHTHTLAMPGAAVHGRLALQNWPDMRHKRQEPLLQRGKWQCCCGCDCIVCNPMLVTWVLAFLTGGIRKPSYMTLSVRWLSFKPST